MPSRLPPSTTLHAFDATGSGVVPGRYSPAEHDLVSSRLVAPYDLAMNLPARYRFNCPKGFRTRPQVAVSEECIVAQSAETTCFTPSRRMIALDDIGS